MSRRILAVFAHPDDETYGPGGTLAAAARHHDTRVRLLIATRGEAGSLGISRNYEPGELARIRQWEMTAAAGTMGAELALLGFPDGGVSGVPEDELLRSVVTEIRQFRPHTLVTFHPNGLSGHPDHRRMTRIAVEAGRRASDADFAPGNPPPWRPHRLWFFALSDTRAGRISHRRRVHSVPEEEIDRIVDVGPWLAVKHRMARDHATQLEFFRFLDDAAGSIDAYWGREDFVLSEDFSGAPSNCHDLFYGLDREP